MLSNAVRFLMVSAAASVVALGAAPADACSQLSSGALNFISAGTPSAAGAVFLTSVQKEEFWSDPDPIVDAVNDAANMSYYWGSTSPSSEKYYTEFTKPGAIVSLISNISNVAAGDVLVINKTVASGVQTAYGGHTVIVTGPAQQLTTALNPIYSGTVQWALPIADSTSSVHGCSTIWRDSRWTNTCSDFVAGPGTGYMRIYTDTSGVPVGHTWSVTSVSAGNYFPISSTTVPARPFVIGRLNSCPLPTPTP
ncbi:putative secreted protein [Sorangium cellulosum So ce56]|uniref:Secreted protein n=1 Tax=Sorangium cellulosum (strain So ce56) TaxID=448385 RepID=A9G775_SORC5|nr:hypothetical protein [Sorangium cellulosum]CAN92787.1 putative secreted protein [Sorangium cellulosum So ce56]